ncbi:MAG: hypothetical protein V9E90_05195 [Saprospiraceae bacterium]|jgi:hypothetical protein
MNQNKTRFLILTILMAIASLFIPFWFAVFILAMGCSMMFEISSGIKIVSHFIIYYVVCLAYCIYAMLNGSNSLVQMISGVFQGVAPSILVFLTGFIYGVTALLGAWTGNSLRNVFWPTEAN